MADSKPKISLIENDPFWYKDAVIYQLHVKSYYDSNEDGVGDFKGLTEKLDYIQDLGVTAIWLLPFYPSPLRDDGYDISDYKNIHPAYGTLRDFRQFMKTAHNKGIRVITELVVNHTSDQHPWFQRARNAKPGSSRRDWYVWSDTPDRYPDTRVIFQDFESSNWAWDPVAKAYYWHRFYSHQPDLNYDNPQVQKAIFNVMNFWLDHGVDGLRMDAVPYLFEREGTNCENLPESHEFVKRLRAHIDKKYENRMLLAEANQWPEDAVAYFGNGDEFHMAFHFPLMPRLYMALRMEDAYPILDIMDQTPVIPDGCQWAIFLRNHDELTLEMVTDEERDYMYRVYAQDPRMRLNLGIRRRLFPLLGNHRRRIELMNALLFSMPGAPIIYYGDELGMGDNIHLGDRDGVRTPMQWSADRNAGFSRTNPQALYLPVIISPEYHFEVINAEVQQQSRHSMLWWMKRMIGLRKRFKAFSRGAIEFLHPENHHILAFIRRYEGETILVVLNLSRYVQYVELDLSSHPGCVPIELFGRAKFPVIGAQPYFLSLGPHSFYWFYLTSPEPSGETAEAAPRVSALPEITAGKSWESLFRKPANSELEGILSIYFKRARWFGGKAREVKNCSIQEIIPVANSTAPACILLIQVDYMAEDAETYVLPVTYAEETRADAILNDSRWAAIARLRFGEGGNSYLLVDALADPDFCRRLLQMISRSRRIKLKRGEVLTTGAKALRTLATSEDETLEPAVVGVEQSNTSVIYGKQYILKVIRRLTPGVNPDLEIGRFLTEKKFPHTPPTFGAIEYRGNRQEVVTLSTLQGYVPNQGDAWEYTLDVLGWYFENVLAQRPEIEQLDTPPAVGFEPMDRLPPECFEWLGTYCDSARLMGQRTAQLHLCLASDTKTPQFKPERFTKLYQRSLYQSMRTLAGITFLMLRKYASEFPEIRQQDIQIVLQLEKDIQERFRSLLSQKISAMRIRCHGDYHLGQVLYTGKDFMMIDFEGEPARPISQRRIKRSPVRDVAGMLRSFHYAAYTALSVQVEKGLAEKTDRIYLEACAHYWYRWTAAIFLRSYIEAARQGRFLPQTREEFKMLLDAFLLEKAVYELSYEMNNRPGWIHIPLHGILQLMQADDG